MQTIQVCGEILQNLMNVNVQISCQGILIIAARLISLNKSKQALELLLMKQPTYFLNVDQSVMEQIKAKVGITSDMPTEEQITQIQLEIFVEMCAGYGLEACARCALNELDKH